MIPLGMHSNNDAPVRLSRAVARQILETIGRRPAEQGGALGGTRRPCQVEHFRFDGSARTSGATYSPDHVLLNRLFATSWNPRDIRLLGFVHSHPGGFGRPSGGDLEYAERILGHMDDLERLLLPIVITEPDAGHFEMRSYAAVRAGRRVRTVELDVVLFGAAPGRDAVELVASGNLLTLETEARPERPSLGRSYWHILKSAARDLVATVTRPLAIAEPEPETEPRPVRRTPAVTPDATFERVRTAYDLPRLAASRCVAIGAGGAASFLEELARTGVGEFVLVDPDIVGETNLATQQVYRADLGRSKVECLEERIRDIQPGARIVTIARPDDEIDDVEMGRLLTGPLKPGTLRPMRTLLCGLTDSFPAQARVNRLALEFGVPSLCAQVYRQGLGAEITFTYPGTTPACHRCILASRYRAYLDEGFRNDVTSDGTPIFSTTRLNALKGVLAMALLHHGGLHPRWGGLLEAIGSRNLVQIRMSPELSLPVFERVFAGGDRSRILFDEAVWLPQEPERGEDNRPVCPDCLGCGDLRDRRGRVGDTRAGLGRRPKALV